MAIQRWDPLRELMQIQDKINRLFEEVVTRSGQSWGSDGLTPTGWKPPVDVFEQPDRYVFRADLPGLTASDVELEVEDGILVLRGERRLDPSVAREAYLRDERPHGRFCLQVTLPPSVDRQSIKASHREGVLEVVLPKRSDTAPGRVRVQVG